MTGSIRSAGIACIAIILTSAAAAPAPGDACSLLTKEDAAAALGEAVTGPKTKTMPDGAMGPGTTLSYCEYTGSGYNRVQLNLTGLAASSVPMYRSLCAKKKSDDLAGLGDVACWYDDKHEELHAIKGAAFISVELHRSGNPTEAIKGVMKKALGRLK